MGDCKKQTQIEQRRAMQKGLNQKALQAIRLAWCCRAGEGQRICPYLEKQEGHDPYCLVHTQTQASGDDLYKLIADPAARCPRDAW